MFGYILHCNRRQRIKSWRNVIAVFGEPAGALERWTRSTLIWEILEGAGQYFLLGTWQHDELVTSSSLCHPAGIALSATSRLLGQDISALPGKGNPGNPFTLHRLQCWGNGNVFCLYLFLLNNVESNQTIFGGGEWKSNNWEENSCSVCCSVFSKGPRTFPASAN